MGVDRLDRLEGAQAVPEDPWPAPGGPVVVPDPRRAAGRGAAAGTHFGDPLPSVDAVVGALAELTDPAEAIAVFAGFGARPEVRVVGDERVRVDFETLGPDLDGATLTSATPAESVTVGPGWLGHEQVEAGFDIRVLEQDLRLRRRAGLHLHIGDGLPGAGPPGHPQLGRPPQQPADAVHDFDRSYPGLDGEPTGYVGRHIPLAAADLADGLARLDLSEFKLLGRDTTIYIAALLRANGPGEVELRCPERPGLRAWLDGAPLDLTTTPLLNHPDHRSAVVDLDGAGGHLLFRLDEPGYDPWFYLDVRHPDGPPRAG